MDVATIVSPGVLVVPSVAAALALPDGGEFGRVVTTLVDSSSIGTRGAVVLLPATPALPVLRSVDASLRAALRDIGADASTQSTAILLPGRGGAVLLSVHIVTEPAGSSATVSNLPAPTLQIGVPGTVNGEATGQAARAGPALPQQSRISPRLQVSVPADYRGYGKEQLPAAAPGALSIIVPTTEDGCADTPAAGYLLARGVSTGALAAEPPSPGEVAGRSGRAEVADARTDVAPEQSGDVPVDRPSALRHGSSALRGASAKIASRANPEVFAPAVSGVAIVTLTMASLTSTAMPVAAPDAPKRNDKLVRMPGPDAAVSPVSDASGPSAGGPFVGATFAPMMMIAPSGLAPPLETPLFIAGVASAGPSPTTAGATDVGTLPPAVNTPAGAPVSPLDAAEFAPGSRTAAMQPAPTVPPALPDATFVTPSVTASRRPAAMLAARGGQPQSAIAATVPQPHEAASYAPPLLHRQGDPPSAVPVVAVPEAAAPDRAPDAAPIEVHPPASSSAFATLVGEVGLDAPAAAPDPPMPYRATRAAHDIGIVIAQRLADGAREVTIRLNPVDFGRIDVRMSFDDSGKLRANVSADNPVVLDLLRRDVGQLVGAMSDAGITSDQRSFRFEPQADSGQGQRPAGDGGNQPREQRQSPDRSPFARYVTDDREAATAQPLRWTSQIDVKA